MFTAGAPELDVDASWRSYVAWAVQEVVPLNEARWVRWVNDDCKRLKRDRVRDRERERSGPRLSVVREHAPPQPYHAPFVPSPEVEAPADRELALEASRRLAAGAFS
jgi:hypothetical protein